MGWVWEDLSELGHGTFPAFQLRSNLNHTKRKQGTSCQCEHSGHLYKNPNEPCILLAILLIQGFATHPFSLHTPPLSKFSIILSIQHHAVLSPALRWLLSQEKTTSLFPSPLSPTLHTLDKLDSVALSHPSLELSPTFLHLHWNSPTGSKRLHLLRPERNGSPRVRTAPLTTSVSILSSQQLSWLAVSVPHISEWKKAALHVY